MGATDKVRNRLEKLGVGKIIPPYNWQCDRITALQEGLRIVREKQSDGEWAVDNEELTINNFLLVK